VESYEYERREETVERRAFETVNGAFTMQDLPKADDESSYYITLTAMDSKGRATVTTAYLGDIYMRYGGSGDGTHRYQLIKKADPARALVTESNGNTRFDNQLYAYEDGEDVTFTLMDNDAPIEAMKGRVLYATVQDDFSDITLSETADTTLKFSEALVPNYQLTGAYFDGKHVFALENTYMSFNPHQRELAIEIEPDKGSYRPGEAMKVEATVTNAITGAAAANTEVVLSVVDEAVFAISEQNTNILRSLYQDIYWPHI
jgi:hypothetical protein